MSTEIIRAVNITLGIMGMIIGILAILASNMLPDENTKYWNAIKDWRKIWILNTIQIVMDIISNIAEGQVVFQAVVAKNIVEFSAYLINYAMLVLFASSMIRRCRRRMPPSPRPAAPLRTGVPAGRRRPSLPG